MRATLSRLALACCLAAAPVLLAGPAAADSVYAPGWSAVHADAANTDYAPLYGAADVTLAWQVSFGGSINLGPTIDPEGRVYVTQNSPGCHVFALDGATGETVWCSEEVDLFAVVSSPLLDRDGRLFLADGEAMHAFDRDGTLLWETPIIGVPLSAQFTPAGRLLFITHIGYIYVLERDNGAPVMSPVALIPGATFDPADGLSACARGTEDCPSANTLAIDLASGRFFFTFWAPGAPQAGLRAMHISEDPVTSVTPLWTSDALPGGSASSPTLVADGSRLYVNDNVGSMHALDAASGATLWSFPIGFASGGSPSLAPDGLLMPAGAGQGRVLALRDTGDAAVQLWRREDLVNRGIPTQVAGGLSYATVDVGSFRNDLVVVDTATGAELDREPIPGTSLFTVGTTVGPDGTVYVPTILGDLYAYRPANPACPAVPRSDCRRSTTPAKSTLLIRDQADDASDVVHWKWPRGAATTLAELGVPTGSTAYALCLYDESASPPRLRYGADVPAGDLCGGRPCWKATSAGFARDDPQRAPHGVQRLALVAGGDGRARIALRASAANTFAARNGAPPLPLPLPARLQLLADGVCWETTYAAGGVRRNDAGVFRARGS